MRTTKPTVREHPHTFVEWLRGQRKRQDAVGDIARDVAQDPGFPRGDVTLKRCLRRLDRFHACSRAYDAMERAFDEYQRDRRRHRFANVRPEYVAQMASWQRADNAAAESTAELLHC